MAKITYATAIQRDLQDIEEYISKWAAQRAVTFVEELWNKCEDLSQFPARGTPRDDIDIGIRHQIHGNYIILYRYSPDFDTVHILRITEGSRDLTRIDLAGC